MSTDILWGYAGKILRIDLSKGSISTEPLDESLLREYPGGASLGIRMIYDEVPPEINWSDPKNRLFLGSGPLGGTRIGGSGSLCLVTKSAITNGMISTQANGFFGAFLRLAGYDALILQGAAPSWSYIYIHDGKVEIRSATGIIDKNSYLYIHDDSVELRDTANLSGKSAHEVEELVKRQLGKDDKDISILSIGPAGEYLVKFSYVYTNKDHIAAHNGVGAVLGSKKIKAIAVARGKNKIRLKDANTVSHVSKELKELAFNSKPVSIMESTLNEIAVGTVPGFLPVNNYASAINILDTNTYQNYSKQNIRERSGRKLNQCWSCNGKYCQNLEIQHASLTYKEPFDKQISEFSSLEGIHDVTMSLLLSGETERLGLDINETGYLISWILECYEKKLITMNDTDGLEMTRDNGEAIKALLNNIAYRRGFGNLLAEGVRYASASIGKEAQKLAIYTLKRNSSLGQDRRIQWTELINTCISNPGTLKTHAPSLHSRHLPQSSPSNGFDLESISSCIAQIKGSTIFEDSMVTCHLNTSANLDLLCKAFNAATGWSINKIDAMTIGRRAASLARVYNLRCGIENEIDAPAITHGLTPLDSIAAGEGILPHWDKILRNYYSLMGWDEKTGKPLPETMNNLGLQIAISDIWD
jgi:aldehyde:ferredoxin oxidoreductase